MKIAMGSDHAGFALKAGVKKYLLEKGFEVEDFGTHSEESMDFPDVAFPVAEAVAKGAYERGILICGTGGGMVICANKVPGVRAVLCDNDYTAEMSRAHNDANVLTLGGRVLKLDEAKRIVDTWFSTAFEGGRHTRRVDKVTGYEKSGRGKKG